MKKYYFFLAVLLMVVSVYAQNNQEFFLQANLAYEQGNYDKSLELYEKISHKGSAVWYNMGNCSYKQGNIVGALVYWKRAQQQANSSQYGAIERNIQTIKKQHGIDYEAEGWLTVFFKKVSQRFSLFTWQLLFFLFWIFLCLGMPIIKRNNVLVLTCTMIGLLLIGNFLRLKSTSSVKQLAIVKEDTPTYIGPSDRFAQQTVLKKAQEVTIKEKNNHWCKIETTKKIGWISGEKIIEI